MFKDFSYKKKCLMLLVVFPIILIIAYFNSFSKTLEAKNTLKQLKAKLILVDNAQQEFLGLKRNVNKLDAIIGKEVASPDIVQQEIFDIFSEIPYKSDLLKLDESHKFKDAYFNVYTNNLLLKGDFVNLLKTTYYYEREFEYSRLVSLSFFTKEHPKNKRNILFEQLIFQNYDKK